MYIKVAVNIPSDKTFTYSIPESLKKDVLVGKRVLVPLEKRKLTGYIVEVLSDSNIEKTKEIIDILDKEPLFNEADFRFYQWVSQYYIYPLGKALSEILPGGIDHKSNRWILPSKDRPAHITADLKSYQQKIMDTFADFPDGLPLPRLEDILKKNNLYSDIRSLQGMNLIEVEDRMKKPDILLKKEKIASVNPDVQTFPKMAKSQQNFIEFLKSHGPLPFPLLRKSFSNLSSLVKTLERKGYVSVSEAEVYRSPLKISDIGQDEGTVVPNEDQQLAIREIVKGLKSDQFSAYLLHGVTGSGKTEVYISAMEETLRLNGSAMFLVPEIALTPQLLSRLNRRFQDHEIAVLHSAVSQGARYDQWRRIIRGDIRIVVGARSALFAPLKNLKLIIVDEEHDTSYKQDDRMRYNARDMALMRAKLLSGTVVAGSATPSAQTYFNTMQGKYTYLVLPSRVENRPMPKVDVVDMKREAKGTSTVPILSRSLQEAIRETLANKKQTILFLNRRGFHTFMFCPDCGYVFHCMNCAVSMTHHADAGILKCHHCDYSTKLPSRCPGCKSTRVMQYGIGTERLEGEIKRIFPTARVGRMDRDSTAARGSFEKILRALNRHEIDILVGTQMITKGHDFQNVTLVGIISADTSLNLPDFRAAERTFQLLTQASGRGGRGDSPGRVIIQTFNPDHYAVRMAKDLDYPAFYSEELSSRELLGYPPYSRMISLHLSSAKLDSGKEGIEKLQKLVKELTRSGRNREKLEIIGPAASPISKMKGRYRWQLLMKGKDRNRLNDIVHHILAAGNGIGLDIKVDVDPVNFM
jgi:primosomal protein N' (replication factor Y)